MSIIFTHACIHQEETMSNIGLQIFGTVASIIIAISLMMRNLKRLRFINLVGAALFALYGLGISSIPVFLVNAFIAFIDIWYLLRMRVEKAKFSLLHLGSGDSEYLKAFLAHYEADIIRFHPGFKAEGADGCEAIFVLRDTVPASLLLYKRRGEGVFDLYLDYATPAYRDYKNAEFFFAAVARDLTGKGEARFYVRSVSRTHLAYLKRMGFVATGEKPVLPGAGKEYVKTIRA